MYLFAMCIDSWMEGFVDVEKVEGPPVHAALLTTYQKKTLLFSTWVLFVVCNCTE